MSVSYTKTQRTIAKQQNLALISIDIPGLTFQGPVPPDEAQRLGEWLRGMIERRRAWLEGRGEDDDGEGE